MMFMVNLEVPVVVTALVAITNDLGGFDSVGWVVSSYLLGYVGSCLDVSSIPLLERCSRFCIAVIVIFAKFSDIFGRKLVFMLSTAIFIIFSAACSAAQTIVQLYVPSSLSVEKS